MRKVLIVGAASAIAEATARRLAAGGDRLFLVARSADRLHAMSSDLEVRGADRVGSTVMDALEYHRHPALIEEAAEALGGLDTVLIAHGMLPDQHACEASFEHTREALEVNLLSVLSLLTHVANRFERQRQGTIAVISSVAGDRGRRSNYVYGTAKGALTIFLQGLRHRMHKAGVRVVTIKPGFVDTPMTGGFTKGPLWVSPDVVAKGLVRALDRGPAEVYLPWFWRWVMLIIRAIPTPIFNRLPL